MLGRWLVELDLRDSWRLGTPWRQGAFLKQRGWTECQETRRDLGVEEKRDFEWEFHGGSIRPPVANLSCNTRNVSARRNLIGRDWVKVACYFASVSEAQGEGQGGT